MCDAQSLRGKKRAREQLLEDEARSRRLAQSIPRVCCARARFGRVGEWMDGRADQGVRHGCELIEHIIDVRLSMYVYGSHPPGHPRERSFPSVPSSSSSSSPRRPFRPPYVPSTPPLFIPPCLSLTNGAAHGNANFCAGRVVVLTRRKTSNGELTFSFVSRARVRGRRYFPKVAALNCTVDGRCSRALEADDRRLALAKFNCRALCYSCGVK